MRSILESTSFSTITEIKQHSVWSKVGWESLVFVGVVVVAYPLMQVYGSLGLEDNSVM